MLLAGALVACSSGGGEETPAARPTASTSVAPAPSTTVPPPTSTLAPGLQVAADLIAAETAIHDPSTPATDMDRWGQVQQAAVRMLLFHPELEAEALALLPDRVRAATDAHLAAAKDLTALAGPVDPARPLPSWRIVTPEPAAVLLNHYKQAEATVGVPWEYLAAIHLVETRMGRIRGDSSAGARGPMQFIPTTWDIYGEGGDIESTADSIAAAARLLRANGATAHGDATWPAPCSRTTTPTATCGPSPSTPSRWRPTNGPTSATTAGRCTTANASSPRAPSSRSGKYGPPGP